MRKQQRNKILITYFNEKEKFDKLARYMVHLISDDPSSPKESIHTILYRIKDEGRLIEKITKINSSLEDNEKSITHKNYQERIGDIIGLRIICLRFSDIIKVKKYLELLAEERVLLFMRKPDHKRSFVLPIDPGKGFPQDLNLNFSGYSSIHYQVKLGANSDANEELKMIQVELQLRTILEEAWGEIDHKYRYIYNRVGDVIPEYIHSGFYNLSAFLQAAAMQAEHLCREVEAYRLSSTQKPKGKKGAMVASEHTAIDAVEQLSIPLSLISVLEDTAGFKPTVRTLTYILKRLRKLGYSQRSKGFFKKMFTMTRFNEFSAIYKDILNRDPFKNTNYRNIDLINAINFSLFDEIEGKNVAKEGLISTLKWRKKRSSL